MNHASTRILGGLLLLAVVWIGTYWIWTPRTPRISFAASPSDEAGGDGANSGGIAAPAPSGLTASDEADGPPLVSPNAGVIPPGFHQYTVQPGDSFQSIAERFFGADADGSVIARSNPLMDPRRLRAGRVILVPKDPGNIQGIPTATREPEKLSTQQPDTNPNQSARSYTVQRGDSLSLIAQRLLGSPKYADAIFQANRSSMASKDAIKVGQVLIIPEVPQNTTEQR
jgi:nucleoid-associated protein YgaU